MGGGGGGGSGGPFKSAPSKDIADKLLNSSREGLDAEFGAELSDFLSGLLGEFNTRDAPLARRRLSDILKQLGKDIEGTISPLFGGSVAKSTHVEGLSDVDTLLRLDSTELADRTPQQALDAIASALRERLAGKANVSKGTLAATIRYSDGMEIQLLPALSTPDGLRIPAWRGDRWSDINPESFASALAKANRRVSSRLIPTLKLAKAINATLPETQQLSGYHIESLGIEAFRGYSGETTTSKMLVHFFERARDLVLRPIKDRTGQSVHVDDHLGAPDSVPRLQTRHLLDRIYRRMQAANAHGSIQQWRLLFDL
jgi:hypothetical protein